MSQLVTVNRAKQNTCFTDTGTTLLTNLLKASSGFVEQYCNRKFESATYTEMHDGKGVTWLYVRNTPVTTLTSVTIQDSSGVSTVVPSGDLILNSEMGRVHFGFNITGSYYFFPKAKSNTTVVYTAGYASDSIPDDLQEAVIQVTKNLLSTTSVDDVSVKSQKMGTYSYTLAAANDEAIITPLVQALLLPYRRVYL